MGGLSSDKCFNPNLFVISLFVQELKSKLDFLVQNELNCRVKFGLAMTVQDCLQARHQDCEVKPGNQSWIFHVLLCTLGSYLYIWGEYGKGGKLLWITLGSFLVSSDDVWRHGGLCGGVVNLQVHGGIFDIIAIEITTKLTYPYSTSLTEFNSGNNAVHLKKDARVDYDNSIDLLGKKLLNW